MGKIKSLAKAAIDHNFYSYCLYHYYREVMTFNNHTPPIVVYSGVKTGSTTMANSLKKAMPTFPVYHVHFLSQKSLAKWKAIYKESFTRIRRVPRAYFASKVLSQKIKQSKLSKDWTIICGIRDPIAQMVSWFFYEADVFQYPRMRYHTWENQKDLEINIQLLIDDFIKLIADEAWKTNSHLLGWFQLELKEVFGLDLESTGFPKSQGFEIYRGNHSNILIYKLESLRECADEAIGKLLGNYYFKLNTRNKARESPYSKIYARFCQKLSVPLNVLEDIYDNTIVHTIYNEEEISDMIKRWSL